MRKLNQQGYEVVVFTTRATHEQGKLDVAQWLSEHGVSYDSITAEKLDARHYIDDKAVAFKGDWNETLGHVVDG